MQNGSIKSSYLKHLLSIDGMIEVWCEVNDNAKNIRQHKNDSRRFLQTLFLHSES